jgi:mycothiol S-conjugate amidase
MARIIRAERPQVVVCYDPSGGYPHPDHIRDNVVTEAALEMAADPDQLPDAGPAWTVPKLYYYGGFSKRRLEIIHAALLERGLESPFGEWLEKWEERDRKPLEITTQVDVAKYLPQARDALIAHATQIDPNGFWFAIPEEVVAELYPWDDYHLVRSSVPAGPTVPGIDGKPVEGDLFEGFDAEGRPLA